MVPQRARWHAVATARPDASAESVTSRNAPAPAATRRHGQVLKLKSYPELSSSFSSTGAASAAARPARQVSASCALQWGGQDRFAR